MNRCTRRRSVAGQSLIIFAVVITAVIALLGLAIDSSRAYVTASRELQAAKAGALAGVVYMPGDITTATKVAKVEAARNGFYDGNNANGRSVTVAVAMPAGTTNQLQVTVSDNTSSAVLPMLGFGQTKVVQSVTAYYLPPLQLGQPGVQMGSDLTSLGTANNYFFMRTQGWATHRSEGDSFSTTANQGGNGCTPTPACAANPRDNHLISSARGSDLTTAFTANDLPSIGGYNYLVYVPAGLSTRIQVFNPAFAPDTPGSTQINGANYELHEYDGGFPNKSQTATDYSATMYTVFKVGNIFNRTGDTPLSQQTYLPYDAWTDPGKYHTLIGGAWNAAALTPIPFDYHQWVDVLHAGAGAGAAALDVNQHPLAAGTDLIGGASGTYYRLRVDSLNYDGSVPVFTQNNGAISHKGYSVRLVDPASCTPGPCTPSANTFSLGAMDDLGLFTPITASGAGSSFAVPLFSVPKEYRNQTLAIYLFDVGDVSNGNCEIKITIPQYLNTGGTITPASTSSQVGLNAVGNSLPTNTSTPIAPVVAGKADVLVESGGTPIDNGSWIQFLVTVPADYNPGSALYWSLEYDVTGTASAGDTMGVQVSLTGGAPVHLLP